MSKIMSWEILKIKQTDNLPRFRSKFPTWPLIKRCWTNLKLQSKCRLSKILPIKVVMDPRSIKIRNRTIQRNWEALISYIEIKMMQTLIKETKLLIKIWAFWILIKRTSFSLIDQEIRTMMTVLDQEKVYRTCLSNNWRYCQSRWTRKDLRH